VRSAKRHCSPPLVFQLWPVELSISMDGSAEIQFPGHVERLEVLFQQERRAELAIARVPARAAEDSGELWMCSLPMAGNKSQNYLALTYVSYTVGVRVIDLE